MSPAFSRSLRAVDADRAHGSLLGILVAASILVAWLAWLFAARVALYEVSDTATLEIDATGKLEAVATLGAATLGRVQPGQAARLRLDGFPWTRYGTVPATVRRVTVQEGEDTVRVELALHPRPDSAIPLQAGMPGRVEIEVGRVSPATLLLRAVGRQGER